jgi:hypothetical protein
LALLLGLALSGCTTTTYQPLVSLLRPFILDPQVAIFVGLRVLVRCITSEHFGASAARPLCRRIANLFTGLGAKVESEVPRLGFSQGLGAAADKPEARPDMVIEIRSRLLHQDNSNTLLWIASFMTYTLVPAITDSTVAVDVTIRDADGFLLVSDSLQARFIQYFGFGMWAKQSN